MRERPELTRDVGAGGVIRELGDSTLGERIHARANVGGGAREGEVRDARGRAGRERRLVRTLQQKQLDALAATLSVARVSAGAPDSNCARASSAKKPPWCTSSS